MPADLRDQLQASLGSAYALERELGGGGMARVFVATETALGRRVVIKVLPPELAHAVSAERFRQEVRLAARLQHPHVVPLLAAGEADGFVYYTMPYVQGQSLRARLTRDGELPVPEAVKLLREVADALACAHADGVVHRDLKPENVLLSRGHALVADFGVAKALVAAAGADGDTGGLTSAGVALGTPAYMAPEQAAADPAVDHRADLYALGVIAYEVLTGGAPFAGRTPQQLAAAHLTTPPEPIQRRRQNLPPAVSALVMRLLEKRPADRPQSAEEVVRELDASGPQVSGSVAAAPAAGKPRPSVALQVAAAALALGAAFLATRGYVGTRSSRIAASDAAGSGAPKSVAVLPFANVGGDTATQYFADGMTDEMIGALGKVDGLRVPGRTSVFALRGRNLNPRTIGDTLGVATLLEGSVRRAGNRIRVGAQLVSVADNAVLWSDEYDRELKDVFAVQDELARAIVASLRVRLSGADTGALVRRPTDDLTAYELYLRGRSSWSTRSPAGIERAISSFEQALARDPEFAPAHAGLAMAYLVQPLYENIDPAPAWAKARASAERALALDSTLADAHASLGYGLMIYAWDWAAAERELRRSISLNPSYATGHHWYGDFLGGRGRFEEAGRELQTALALDPLALVIRADLAWKLYAQHRYDEAAAEFNRVLATDPSFHSAHALLGMVYLQQGLPARAVEELRRSVELQGRGGYAQDVATLAYAQARAGDESGARRHVRDLTDRARREYIHPSALAIAYTGLGDADEAFRWLDRAVQQHDARLAEAVLFDPLLDPLRADPRFARMRARMGLKP